jgi:small neutral amino acid transporter SnatA (MarC family)
LRRITTHESTGCHPVLWLVIVLSIRIGLPSGGFVHDTVTLFMGLIVIAMGVQFALTGIRAFFSHAAQAGC